MSATASTSQGASSAILQQPMPQATRIYLDRLAREIEARGDGLQDDDLWRARSRLRGISIQTLRVGTASLWDMRNETIKLANVIN